MCVCIFVVFAVEILELAVLILEVAKRPRFGTGPTKNRTEFCVVWLSKATTSETFWIKNVSLKLSNTRSFDGNARGNSAHFPGLEIPCRLTVKLVFCRPHDAETPLLLTGRSVEWIEIPLRLTPKDPTSET